MPTIEQRQVFEDIEKRKEDAKNQLPKDAQIVNNGFADIGEKLYKRDDFKSTHYDEANILVHLRMNTRTDADGNKVLFLEEVQSDWGQQGKKEGFKDTSEQESIINKSKEKISEYNKSLKKLGLLPNSSTSEIAEFKQGKTERTSEINKAIARLEKYKDTVRSNRDWDAANKEIEKYETEKITIRKEILSALNGIEIENEKINIAERSIENANALTPQAPFVTDTNAWTKLGLKVALKEAVKQGADKISWTTGEQQNDRYDLSKSVDSISYVDNKDGTYHITVYDKNNSNNVLNETKRATLKDIEALLGKDIAEKISNSESNKKYFETLGDKDKGRETKVIFGEGLKVGGKGMKGFYGSPSEGKLGIVGEVAKSLTGQEPKITKIAKSEGKLRKADWGDEVYELVDNNGNVLKTYGDKEAALKITNSTPQHSIEITPELKQSVESGIPLFKGLTPKEQSKQRIEAAKKAFIEKSKNMSSGGFQALPEFVELIIHC